MIGNSRIDDIVSRLSALGEKAYPREAVLPELLALQRQMVEILFNDTHADLAGLKTWDVKRHLIQMNEERGNVADAELATVVERLKEFENLISGEITGINGEKKTFRELKKVCGPKRMLTNVEFTHENYRTELDAILFTSKAVFVVEVKNPRKNVVIDERGNFYRVSDRLTFDKNLGEKMSDKTYLLREALHDTAQAEVNIESIVVFTNPTIEVENRSPYIKTCFLSELPYLIDSYAGDRLYGEEDMARMSRMVSESACKELYPVHFNAEEFKYDFAALVSKLEDADRPDPEGNNAAETPVCPENEQQEPVINGKNRHIRKTYGAVGRVPSVVGLLAGIAVAFLFGEIYQDRR